MALVQNARHTPTNSAEAELHLSPSPQQIVIDVGHGHHRRLVGRYPRQLLDCGVDLINTDQLEKLKYFLQYNGHIYAKAN